MTTKMKTKANIIRFRKYGHRFIVNTDTGIVTVYGRTRNDAWGMDTETKMGTVSLLSAAFRLLNGTDGDSTVRPVPATEEI